VMKGIPTEDLQPFMRDILIEKFGAKLKPGVTPIGTTDLKLPEVEETKAQEVKSAVVVFQRSGKEITCDNTKPLLKIAADAGITIETSCQAGSCGTCKQSLVSGTVEYPDNVPAALSDAEQANFVLTCSAHPVGRVVLDL
jgi:ferredoxin-nitrite reductase